MPFLFFAFLLFFFSVAPSGAASGKLSGMAEWRYGEHWAEEDGRRVLDGSHFTQHYSVLYQTQGVFLNGRGGKYNLGLGYEWNAVDSELNGVKLDENPDKILYRGEVIVAPGGVPFNLHAYSHDLQRTTFIQETESELFRSVRGQDGRRRQGTIVDFSNGQRIQTGVTMVLGIKNGSYLGKYRDILSKYPKILLDYRETQVDDPHGDGAKYVTRELAFVSLNKKDNWFHYRFTDHEDEIHPDQNYNEKIFTLGTIDHHLQRQWVNMTNWIRVSADANLTIGEREAAVGPNFNRYDLNLFAIARRARFESSTFTTYTRAREPNRIDTELEVPFYLNGNIDRNTAYRYQFIGNREEDNIFGGFGNEEKIVYSALRLETGRQEKVILAPQLRIESKNGTQGEGKAVEAGLEAYTNSRHRPPYDLFGSYLLRYFNGQAGSEQDVDFLEHEIQGRIEKRMRDWRLGLRETASYGSGQFDQSVSRYVGAASSKDLRYDSGSHQARDGSVLHSTTKLYGEILQPRLTNRFELIYDFLSVKDDSAAAQDESTDVWELTHHLRYDGRQVRSSLNSRLIYGEHENLAGNDSFGGDTLDRERGGGVPRNADTSFQSQGRIEYLPNRAWEAKLGARFRWDGSDGGDVTRWLFTERLAYNFFQKNGLGRKLGQLAQEIEYENIDAGVEPEKAVLFTLLADYYPTRILFFGTRVSYRLDQPEETDAYVLDLLTGMNFPKLQVSLNYSYGTRKADATPEELKEQVYELLVRKLF